MEKKMEIEERINSLTIELAVAEARIIGFQDTIRKCLEWTESRNDSEDAKRKILQDAITEKNEKIGKLRAENASIREHHSKEIAGAKKEALRAVLIMLSKDYDEDEVMEWITSNYSKYEIAVCKLNNSLKLNESDMQAML